MAPTRDAFRVGGRGRDLDPPVAHRLPQDLDRLLHACEANPGRIEGDPCRLVLGARPAGPESDLEAALGERSIVASSWASTTGFRRSLLRTNVPIRRSVAAAAACSRGSEAQRPR